MIDLVAKIPFLFALDQISTFLFHISFKGSQFCYSFNELFSFNNPILFSASQFWSMRSCAILLYLKMFKILSLTLKLEIANIQWWFHQLMNISRHYIKLTINKALLSFSFSFRYSFKLSVSSLITACILLSYIISI